MKKTGVIGLGDMGSGLANNLLKAGYETWGFDLSSERNKVFADMGGKIASNPGEVGKEADAVFVMVMKGSQVREVILGENGLINTMEKGSVILLTATINPTEIRELYKNLNGSGINLIDTPVSGGFPGAQAGTLTMMAAGDMEVMAKFSDVMQAVSKNIHHVGTEPGMGQTVKACLQSLIGSIFSATFEASTLAAKAGVEGQVIYDVFSTSGAGCGVVKISLENIIDRKFEGTGSHISTMHKDLGIVMQMARDLGVPMFTAGTAAQLFQAWKTKYPEGDNWLVTRALEDIVGEELNR